MNQRNNITNYDVGTWGRILDLLLQEILKKKNVSIW
jgi:hypothetical protein